MSDAVIVSTARTPIGTAFKGTLAETDAFELAVKTLTETVRRSGLDPALIDDVVLGESLYGGGDIGRYAAIEAGMEHIPGVAQNRHCATGLASVQTASASIIAGMDRAVVAGGVQASSSMPIATWRNPNTGETEEMWLSPSHPETPDAPTRDMTITVGHNAAQRAGITREEMDAWALRSHQRAVAGIDSGAFEEEIFPIEVTKGGETITFAVDEHPRRDSSMEKMAALKPIHPEIDDFQITAGNSAGMNDGAAAVLVADRAFADEHGLEILASVTGWASVGVDPVETGLAPIKVIPKILERTGLSIGDVDLWEINEAFASVPIAACKAHDLDEELVNPLGSGCSLGHPIATTGTRMIITLIHEMRRRGGGTAIAAMCAGGGMASAVALDIPAP